MLAALAFLPLLAYATPPAEAYRGIVQRETQARFGIPAPSPVIAAQIHQESGWNPTARSRTGALGLMQFMPATAQWAETVNKWGNVDPTNPLWAIRAGVWYDRWLFERITAAPDCDRWQFALSAYNGGIGWTQRRRRLSPSPSSYPTTAVINPGITPDSQRENEAYAPRIVYKHQPRYAAWGKTTCL